MLIQKVITQKLFHTVSSLKTRFILGNFSVKYGAKIHTFRRSKICFMWGTKKNCIEYYEYGNSQIWSMKGQEIVNTQIFLL